MLFPVASVSVGLLLYRSMALASDMQVTDDPTRDYLYARIARTLRDQIQDGTFAPGSRLPSLDELTRTHGVNRLTVRRAIQELRREGLVHAIPAQGTYVSRPVPSSGDAKPPRTTVFGLLSAVLVPSEYGPYHQSILTGVHEELDQGDANLLVIAAGKVGQDAFCGLVQRAHADAMIYLGPFEPEILAHLVRQGPPAVVVDHHLRGLPCDAIRIDNTDGALQAVRFLLAKGYGPDGLAVISGLQGHASTQERMQGVMQALDEARIDPGRVPVVCGEYLRTGGERAMRDLLARPDRPRAVFCMNDEMALGALDALHQARLTVPHDVAMIGFDDISLAETVRPRLTTVRVDTRQMGRLAVRLLRNRILHPDASPTVTVIQPALVEREST